MGLEEMFAAMAAEADGDDDAPKSRPLPEAQVATLREACAAYVAGNVYKIGDLVTPRKWSNNHGAGEPHIVVEIGDGTPHFAASDSHETGSASYGRHRDLRILCYGNHESIVAFWAEAYQLEPYTGPVPSEN